jgi:hypothetical protein
MYSVPNPFYINRPINHELMKKTIIEGLQKLESTNVSFIAKHKGTHSRIPCLRQSSIDEELFDVISGFETLNAHKR